MPHGVERRRRRVGALRIAKSWQPGLGARGHRRDFQGAEAEERFQRVALRDVARAPRRGADDRPLDRARESKQRAEQRRLPGTVRAHDSQVVAAPQLEAHASEHDAASPAHGGVLDFREQLGRVRRCHLAAVLVERSAFARVFTL